MAYRTVWTLFVPADDGARGPYGVGVFHGTTNTLADPVLDANVLSPANTASISWGPKLNGVVVVKVQSEALGEYVAVPRRVGPIVLSPVAAAMGETSNT